MKKEQECAILTAEIAKATFGITPSEHKELKCFKRENLRDHMNDLELIFTLPGEGYARELLTAAEQQQGESKLLCVSGPR